MSTENPRIGKWRFTWESQSHSPNLRLFLFDSSTNPSIQCQNLKVLHLPNYHLLITWTEDERLQRQQNDAVQHQQVSLRVPIPRVLVDSESPISFKALDDHIEIKFVLLLPVDHPVVSVLNPSSDDGDDDAALNLLKTLVMDSDVKSLSSMDGVHFYCRSCSTRLTTSPLRNFVEMPSENWREVADNWFGDCCCSFDGASEKLVTRFVNSYQCVKGTCLLTSTAITLHKEDLVKCDFLAPDGVDDGECEAMLDSGSNYQKVLSRNSENGRMHDVARNSVLSISDSYENVAPVPPCCSHTVASAQNCVEKLSIHDTSGTYLLDQKTTKSMELMENQKSFLNGFLGNIFMARSSNLSTNIKWIEFVCPQCSALLGAYPHGDAHVDGGVRLFKCYVSTCLQVGGSGDLFRKYTLEKMFATRLLENAKDELSFRTVVRDLTTESPLLQVVLLNPHSWCATGYCLGTEEAKESISKLDLHPVVKVLFFDCSNIVKSQPRTLEDGVTKNLADEVFMLTRQIEELIESLISSKDILPPSCAFLQGLPLSSLQR